MSKSTLAALASLVLAVIFLQPKHSLFAQEAHALVNGTRLPFYVYHDTRSPDNHYTPSGWMGDYTDLRFDDHYRFNAKDLHHCIRIAYLAKRTNGAGWAGIYWQNPANNWGGSEGGYNLNGARRLVFLARGEKGNETIAQFKVGGIEGNYRDSAAAAIGPLTLMKVWKQYAISLDGQELSSIAGGFCLTMSRSDNPDGAVIYLDNIRFE